MFHFLAENIVFGLIRIDVLDCEKRELYEYSMEVLLLNLGLLMTTFILSLFCSKLVEYIIFILCFVPLRITLGGIHLKYSGMCMVFSILLYVIVIWLSEQLYRNYGLVEMVSMMTLFIITIVLNPIEKDEIGWKNKKIANCLIVFYIAVNITAELFHFRYVSAIILFSLLPSVLFIMEKFKSRVWKTICHI